MNDRAHIVIGVLPPIPQYPNENDVYMTTTSCPFRMRPAFIANRDARMMRAFGRLKPDVTLDQARADLGAVAGQLEKEYPASYTDKIGYGIAPFALREELTHEAQAAAVDPAGRGRLRAADRVRQCGQPDSGAHGAPRTRTHHPHRDGRRRRPAAPPVADREPDSGAARRRRRRRVRLRQHGTAHQVRRPIDAAGARDLAGWLGARLRRRSAPP